MKEPKVSTQSWPSKGKQAMSRLQTDADYPHWIIVISDMSVTVDTGPVGGWSTSMNSLKKSGSQRFSVAILNFLMPRFLRFHLMHALYRVIFSHLKLCIHFQEDRMGEEDGDVWGCCGWWLDGRLSVNTASRQELPHVGQSLSDWWWKCSLFLEAAGREWGREGILPWGANLFTSSSPWLFSGKLVMNAEQTIGHASSPSSICAFN